MPQTQYLSYPDPYRNTLFVAILVLAFAFVPFGSGHAAGDRPSPVSVPVGPKWVGYDGNWSPITVRVGSPPQWLDALPNTKSSETWGVGLEGCDSSITCRTERGGLFFPNESTTWEGVGAYEMGYTLQMGLDGVAYYGYDDVSFDEDISVASQVVGLFTSTEWWNGLFGLGIKRSNFTDANKLSFLSTLAENRSQIPSHSYGYTAGAYNRLKGVPASLTLGGVDQNRFVPSNTSFDLSPDNLPVVALQGIDVSMQLVDKPKIGGNDTDVIPSDNEYLYTIDSSTPFFWFPEPICDRFSKDLGLTYNDTLQLYTYGTNESKYDEMVDWDLKFTFTLSDLPDSTKTVDIEIPFSAFDHKLSFPFPDLDIKSNDEGLRYFPLRKANESSQYTIGRAFLQEAYLAVDYERRNFSISQAKHSANALSDMDIAEIPPYPDDRDDPEDEESGLSTAGKAGIAVGAVAFVALLGLAVFFCWRRRRKQKIAEKGGEQTSEKQTSQSSRFKIWRKRSPASRPSELPADRRYPTEAPADASAARFELPGETPVELPASEVYYDSNGSKYSGSNNGVPSSIGLGAINENSADIRADGGDLPPYSMGNMRRIDTNVSSPSPAFPSPIQGNAPPSEGSHSLWVPSPITTSGEHSTSGSFNQLSQTSSSQALIPHSAPPAGNATGNRSSTYTSRFIENLEGQESSQQDQQPNPSPPLRRKFSWED